MAKAKKRVREEKLVKAVTSIGTKEERRLDELCNRQLTIMAAVARSNKAIRETSDAMSAIIFDAYVLGHSAGYLAGCAAVRSDMKGKK